MAELSSPFGLAYGLGQAAGQIVPGFQQGQRFAQQQALGQVQLEEAQRGLAEQKALDEALSQPTSATGPEGKPVDEQGNPYPTQYHQLGHETMKQAQALQARGYGRLATKLQDRAMELYGKGQGMMAQKVVQAGLLGDVNAVGNGLKQLGFQYDNLQPYTDDQGNLAGYTVTAGKDPDGNPNEFDVPINTLSMVAADPTRAAQFLNTFALGVHKANIQLEGRRLATQGAWDRTMAQIKSREELQKAGLESKEKQAELNRQNRLAIAQLRMQAAREGGGAKSSLLQAAALLARDAMNKNPDLDEDTAMADAIREIKAGKKDSSGVRTYFNYLSRDKQSLTKDGMPSPTSEDGKRLKEIEDEMARIAPMMGVPQKGMQNAQPPAPTVPATPVIKKKGLPAPKPAAPEKKPASKPSVGIPEELP